jgi:lipase
MGTYVSLCCAERHPADTGRLVLVDGGVALPLPDGMSAQEALDATIGPAIARLRRVWSDRVAYRSMWSEHPAFAGGLTPEIERYVLSDLIPCEGGFRSSVNEDAVRFDGEELLTDADVRALLDRRSEPVIVVRAETGLMATPPPLLPPELMERYPQHDWRTVPGSNHYDVLIGEDGAAAVARAIRDATQCD